MPVVNAAIEHNASPNAGADCGIENVMESARRSPSRLRQRSSVRIVVHFHRHVILRHDFLGQRKIPPARNVGRIKHDARFRIERPGGADPNTVNAIGRRRS